MRFSGSVCAAIICTLFGAVGANAALPAGYTYTRHTLFLHRDAGAGTDGVFAGGDPGDAVPSEAIRIFSVKV